MEVIRKLYRNRRIKRKRNITLIVIRIDNNGNLKNSKPCRKCLEYMSSTNKQRIHKIVNLYYSNENGNIEVTKLTKLMSSSNKHLSKRFRNG